MERSFKGHAGSFFLWFSGGWDHICVLQDLWKSKPFIHSYLKRDFIMTFAKQCLDLICHCSYLIYHGTDLLWYFSLFIYPASYVKILIWKIFICWQYMPWNVHTLFFILHMFTRELYWDSYVIFSSLKNVIDYLWYFIFYFSFTSYLKIIPIRSS